MRELFRHRTPVLRTAPGGHFASLRSRSANRLVVLLLSYSVFQCSKLSFSSERLYHARIVRHRTPVLRTAPRGHFAFLRSRSVNRLVVLLLSYAFFNVLNFHSRRSGRICANFPPSYPRPSDCPPGPFRFPPVAVGKPTRRSAPILCCFSMF